MLAEQNKKIMKKQTVVEWYNSKIKLFENWVETKQISWNEYHREKERLINQAKEMESYNAKTEAKKYYLKGFEDAELTETQNCSFEQTMRDAETHFELVYPLK